jgi:hypothetical protein
MAETNRRVRLLADRLGVPRPSYERVRQHLKESRRLKERQREKVAILLGVATYTRPVDHLSRLVD